MDMTSKLIKFASKAEMQNYFKTLFQQMNDVDLFNIYVHQVNDFQDVDTRQFSKRTLIKRRVASIIKKGLMLDQYSTLTGTTQLVGNTEEFELKNILGYNYYNCVSYRAICIYAIPKYVFVDGQKLEFSSYKGLTAYDFPQEIKEVYQKYTSVPERHHFKCSLFDAIKKYESMPKFYTLGVLQFEDGKTSFIKTSPHLYEMDGRLQNLHKAEVEKQIKALYEKYGTKNTEEVIVKSYLEEEKWREDQRLMDI